MAEDKPGLYGPEQGGCTLGHLRKAMEQYWKDLPDDTPVCIERVEDVYFDKHDWTTFEQKFEPMPDSQKFFQAWGVTTNKVEDKDVILVHAHY